MLTNIFVNIFVKIKTLLSYLVSLLISWFIRKVTIKSSECNIFCEEYPPTSGLFSSLSTFLQTVPVLVYVPLIGVLLKLFHSCLLILSFSLISMEKSSLNIMSKITIVLSKTYTHPLYVSFLIVFLSLNYVYYSKFSSFMSFCFLEFKLYVEKGNKSDVFLPSSRYLWPEKIWEISNTH